MQKTLLLSVLVLSFFFVGCAGTGGTSSDTGSSSCDKYMELMECAVSKTPESARAQMQQGLDQTKQAWEAIPADQKEVACGQTLEAAKASYAAMGCTVD